MPRPIATSGPSATIGNSPTSSPYKAVKAFQRISRADHSHWAFLAACHAQLGDAAAAKGAAQEVQQRAPDFSIERFVATQHYKHESDRDLLRAALVKAQLAV